MWGILLSKKLPPKIKILKGIFKGDEDYMITEGYSLGSGTKKIHSITIWWNE